MCEPPKHVSLGLHLEEQLSGCLNDVLIPSSIFRFVLRLISMAGGSAADSKVAASRVLTAHLLCVHGLPSLVCTSIVVSSQRLERLLRVQSTLAVASAMGLCELHANHSSNFAHLLQPFVKRALFPLPDPTER